MKVSGLSRITFSPPSIPSLTSPWNFARHGPKPCAEAIASTEGLGYRIFLMRRYLSMDVILPYVFWITLLAVASDLLLRLLRAWAFPWARGRS